MGGSDLLMNAASAANTTEAKHKEAMDELALEICLKLRAKGKAWDFMSDVYSYTESFAKELKSEILRHWALLSNADKCPILNEIENKISFYLATAKENGDGAEAGLLSNLCKWHKEYSYTDYRRVHGMLDEIVGDYYTMSRKQTKEDIDRLCDKMETALRHIKENPLQQEPVPEVIQNAITWLAENDGAEACRKYYYSELLHIEE